jgi:hypothetical protein
MYEDQYVALLTSRIAYHVHYLVISGERRRSESLPNVSVRVEPILTSDIEHLLAVKPCWPGTRFQHVIEDASLCTHSLRGEMTETT